MGFVGTAVREGLINQYKIYSADLNSDNNNWSGHQNHYACSNNVTAFQYADITFICVNTPMNKDGSCNTSIVESVIMELDKQEFEKNKILVIKSTVVPGFTESINKRLTNSKLSVIFNPEFLTEANFIEEFKNQDRIVLGGPDDSVAMVKDMYQNIWRDKEDFRFSSEIFHDHFTTEYLLTDSTSAEMVKYTTNSFLATKVSFFNEIKQICDKLDVDFDEIISYIVYDKRIGKSHYKVPGPDGKLGFGGSCFCKDLNGLKFLANSLGIDTKVLDAVWNKNLEVRPERDWEHLRGRAVVTDE